MPYGWRDGGWGILWMIASWALIVALVVWLVRSFSGGGPGGTERKPSSLDILDERFARGEISPEEYEERRRTLIGSH